MRTIKRLKQKKTYVGLMSLAITTAVLLLGFHYVTKTSWPIYAQDKQIKIGTFDLPSPRPNNVNRIWLQECKPAIYLYPEITSQVHVTVSPLGHFTKTIPTYPTDGWTVTAEPSGRLTDNQGVYSYLYYESALVRSLVSQPKTGYVVSYSALPHLYTALLPNWQLTQTEQADFLDYWGGKLPKAPYYFVGIVDQADIDRLEPLTVNPKPNTVIRLRLYFKPLDVPEVVSPPILPSSVARQGFTVVEWGGIVDTGNHNFICSQ